MDYIAKNKEIIIKISASNSGKFRFKTRKNNLQFGDTFAARTRTFDESVYLEWQIGYDAIITNVVRGKKDTRLKRLTFVGANGKTKYLSELIYEGMQAGLVSIEKIINLLEEIKKYNDFVDDKKIAIEHNSKIVLNGMSFEETSIKLPTLFMIQTADNTQIEVSIQKQQYATGVQPMVYFCIPIKSFSNYFDLMGHSSKNGDALEYIINKDNADVLFDIMKIFAMCSKRHNYDIIEIIKILIKLSK